MKDLPPNLRVTMTDVRTAGYCPRQTRRWFEHYGLDFRAFLKEGIAADEFLATGDAHAQAVVVRKLEALLDG